MIQQDDQYIDYTLSTKQFAEKFGMDHGTVRRWLQQGYLDGVKRWSELTQKEVWYVRDKLPEHHDRFKQRQISEAHSPFKHNSPTRRREMLRKNFLPVFMEHSNPQIDKYTRADLAGILNISSNVIRTWEVWGLKKTIYRGSRKIWKYPAYYGRQDIIDFLGGEWEKTREKIAVEAKQVEIPLEGYYLWQPDKVFPMGYEGFMAWVREMEIKREDKRQRGWVQVEFLDVQKEFFFNALSLQENGDFKYQYICASRPRGEFKSFDIRLIFLFRFFNMFRETILCAANSREQSTFIQFDEAVKTIEHTEKLRNTPGLTMQKRAIELVEGRMKTFSQIRPIASGQGLLPNTTCVIFTEICNLDDEQFYSQLSGSIRGVPNAMVGIDSTVAPKGHIFWRLHDVYVRGEDPLIYFQHYEDKYYNPETTPKFLAHQKRLLLETEYNKYFRNRWEDAAGTVFTPHMILEMGYLGLRVEG